MRTRAQEWFTIEEQAGLHDFWLVYEANADALERLSSEAAAQEPALARVMASLSPGQVAAEQKAVRERMRRSIAGDWQDYELSLHSQGVLYACLKVPFATWYRLARLSARELTPRLVSALHEDPARLSCALRAMQAYFDLGITTLAEAYLAAKKAEVTSPAPPQRKRVLLVDDDELMARVTTRGLEPDHEVVVVGSVDEALEVIRTGAPFDIIFCDLMLPGRTGIDFFRDLAAAHPGEEQRIVFITGGMFSPTARGFLTTVLNVRIEKPFELDRLRALVNGAPAR